MAAASPPERSAPRAPRPRWPYLIRQLAWASLDLVFTPKCGGCNQLGSRLCAECWSSFQRLGPAVCAECGYPLGPTGVCASGLQRAAPLMGLRSAVRFAGPLRQALHRLKYKRDIILADSLARELARAWQVYALPAWTVLPVPLSAEGWQARGYNQAALLARGFADLARLPYQTEGLTRIRHTPSQVGLPAAARRVNVQGAFQANPARVSGRSFILVDDICTTGATLAACAEALRLAGAAAIWGLTLGRVLPPADQGAGEHSEARPARAG